LKRTAIAHQVNKSLLRARGAVADAGRGMRGGGDEKLNTLKPKQLVIVKCCIELVIDRFGVAAIPRSNTCVFRAQRLARVATSSHNQQGNQRKTREFTEICTV